MRVNFWGEFRQNGKKNCMKITKSTLLGQNCEDTCREQATFLGSQGITPVPRENPGTKFQINWQFNFLDQICFKKPFLVENWKWGHHHLILHIQISRGTKFLPKLTILTFFYQICPKMVCPVKTKKSEQQQWILHILHTRYFWIKTEKVNINSEFCIIKLQ